jgi:glutaredoxin
MSTKLKVFTKNDCPRCPAAKRLGEEIKKEGAIEVEFYSTDEADGLAEAQLYSVLATPTLVLCQKNADEEEIQSWRGEAPTKEDVISYNIGK